jgi:ribonuclease HI
VIVVPIEQGSSVPGPPQIVPDENALTVFTDGASLSAPRRGGVGVHFVHTDAVGNESYFDLDEPGYAGATNNQMELQAVITALRTIEAGRLPSEMVQGITKIAIYTDSLYVADNLRNAIYEWPGADWHTRAGAPVLNADLWRDLVKQYKRVRADHRVELSWGKGHSSSNPHNKAADKLAKRSAQKATRSLGRPVAVRRKHTGERTQRGSVEMLGQRLTIRIITAEAVPQQNTSRYRYEVVSRRSPFRGCVDFAYSDDPTLRAGHTYYVKMGTDQGHPQIVRVIREQGRQEGPDAPQK